ncbi:AAA family ATPase [Rhodococcus sp. NPDC076796]|uniref:ATP-dependent nuclease n=1 Tax=Rhodococcus sp. NPDC076796 TaxID=3154859 RepID=UPI002ADC086E|nr:AAA family ATPase [Rhodococcus sp. (in: high G+C Gram-positive bacteria)]
MGTIVSSIYIENFRSFRKSWFETSGDTVPIIGLNSAGKSNVLRALDLFFNDSIDGQSLDFSKDLSAHLPSKTKKKIGVGVQLEYPSSFGLKGNQAFFKANDLNESISIYKEWSVAPSGSLQCNTTFGPDIDNQKPAFSDGDVAAVTAIVRSVKYHYVSNHIRPADKVAEILEIMRPEIMKSWKNNYKQSGDFLDHLTAAANQMFGPVSQSVSKGIDGLTISAAVPKDLGDLAFDLGMNAIAGADIIHDLTQEGSGAQAFTLLHFLQLQDKIARQRRFGWVQASIWGLEEPESFLHAGLRTRFADDLRIYTESDRRQALITTHDDDFIRSASETLIVSGSPTGSKADRTTSRDAIAHSAKARITSYRHPLVTYTDDPLVVVEGKSDKIYLSAAIRKANLRPRWRLISPDEDFEIGSSGDALQKYFQMNQKALSARPDSAFILALKDWEDGGKVARLDSTLQTHPYSRAIVCPSSLCNPELGKKFVGIERYLPTVLITKTADPAQLESNVQTEVLGIDRQHLESIKGSLASAVNLGADVGDHLVELVNWIDSEVEATLKTVPVESFL